MFSIKVPPLRERKEDIPLLAEHFFSSCKKELGRGNMQLSEEAMEILKSYDWPGNIRELKSLFAKVCLLEESDIILPEHISEDSKSARRSSPRQPLSPIHLCR